MANGKNDTKCNARLTWSKYIDSHYIQSVITTAAATAAGGKRAIKIEKIYVVIYALFNMHVDCGKNRDNRTV